MGGTAGNTSNTAGGSPSSNPLAKITYTAKVLRQILLGDNHSFPKIVDNYGSYGSTQSIQGSDRRAYTQLRISGAYNGHDGYFEYIWDENNICNRRFFNKY